MLFQLFKLHPGCFVLCFSSTITWIICWVCPNLIIFFGVWNTLIEFFWLQFPWTRGKRNDFCIAGQSWKTFVVSFDCKKLIFSLIKYLFFCNSLISVIGMRMLQESQVCLPFFFWFFWLNNYAVLPMLVYLPIFLIFCVSARNRSFIHIEPFSRWIFYWKTFWGLCLTSLICILKIWKVRMYIVFAQLMANAVIFLFIVPFWWNSRGNLWIKHTLKFQNFYIRMIEHLKPSSL